MWHWVKIRSPFVRASSPTHIPARRERVLSSWLVGIGRQVEARCPKMRRYV
ncbi:hypothetical protein MICA_238 [Micavibrio aeruginosavorus ARL-13]|uniref:Uncharacterized protein n=1 Tax=Micavibrio aeruginosavorus (strain ARL-13) TaxID=856793 RepID=G2KQ42_MICAA|nr:hypothetical protein MICA_238 [Micavibrio aeruginosavorus ARL-13]